MTSSDWLTVATFVLGLAASIYFAVRRVKYQGRIVFIRRQSLGLLNATATRLPNLELLYKGAPIGKSIVLVSGYVANDGAIDLTPNAVERPLVCELPGSCSWLEFRVTATSPDLRVTATRQSDREMRLDFGQFRREESFAFEALAQLDDNYAKKHAGWFASFLKWHHRIASFGDVKQVEYAWVPARTFRSELKRWCWFLGSLALVTLLAVWRMTGETFGSEVLAFQYTDAGKTGVYVVEATREGITTLRDVRNGESKKINFADATKTGKLSPAPPILRRDPKSGFALLAVLGVVYLIALGLFVRDPKQTRIHRLASAATKPAS